MLEKVSTPAKEPYMDFRNISRYSTGTGVCYVYNSVIKNTKSGKPFITLHLRDVNGVSIPGYVFDLKSPLIAGGEAAGVVNKVVKIDWQENYLNGIGLTLILDKVSVVLDASDEDLKAFRGEVEDAHSKMNEVRDFLSTKLGLNVSIPVFLETLSSDDYSQGRVGGLIEHYWRMMNALKTLDWLGNKESKKMTATFLLYILAHSSFVRAHDKGLDNISLVTNLTDRIASISTKLKMGAESLELVHMFFGYTAKDVYVRNVSFISDSVKRIDDEFSLYKTIPLEQEGNAGYGPIRRYQIEE